MPEAARIILHVDMDAFYAAVEQLDDPSLRGKPVIVGGLSDRGVVATASYEARKHGVRSAMATRIARRKCPKGIFVKPRMGRYQEISRGIFEALHAVTPNIEKVSIDEAYMDLSNRIETIDEARAMASEIKAEVRERFGLTMSVGVAPCKFVAKIASDLEKPDGLVVIPPEKVVEFLAPMPVGRIPGVGPATEKKLHDMNARSIEQLAETPLATLERMFGKFGPKLYEYARGLDPRPIVVEREAKSCGSENTFERDVPTLEPLLGALRKHAEDVSRRLRRNGAAARTITLKLKYADFKSITRSQSLERPLIEELDLYEVASALLPRTEAGKRPVRLIGLYASGLEPLTRSDREDFFGMTFPG